ncbi:Type I restrictionmodification system specificity subunit S EC 31213 CDS [Bradyrhizobium sp.]|uniref:restriction endonuclease subunit S n=1 Tax=unclassified Bradyrhizobium TaxID=2631580 RepID=UPI0007C18E58|nr:restriction endonuclease subunit S [Bradyrhizobium sp.]CUU13831.1 Type I restrictionmodification system specificity subunit S EC 31213 CDS [Bradyrhizobium sp.]
MSRPVYEGYKKSGLEWLGEIPSHWEVRRISSISTKITNGYVGPTRDIFVEHGVRYLQSLHIKSNRIRFDTPYFVQDAWSRQHAKSILNCGDVLIVQTGDIGQVAVVTDEFAGCNCHALIIVSPLSSVVSGVWVAWVLSSDYGFHNLLSIQTGALHPHLNCGDVKDIFIPIPSLAEQIAIATFLDRETSKIDALVEEQKRLIDLLKEKRQAVVSHTLARGLDPNVPKMDVEWISDVPEHWEVKRIKHLAVLISKGSTPTTVGAEFVQTGVRFLKAENIKGGSVSNEPEFFITLDTHASMARSNLREFDVLVVIAGATTGRSAVLCAELVPANTNQAVAFVRCSDPQHAAFVDLWLSSTPVQERIKLTSVQSAQPNLSMEDLGNILIPMPPPAERLQILTYLNAKLEGLADLVAEANKAIELLEERRAALISAAVTGKIDVRGLIKIDAVTPNMVAA